jgi:hypothetical protein
MGGGFYVTGTVHTVLNNGESHACVLHWSQSNSKPDIAVEAKTLPTNYDAHLMWAYATLPSEQEC